MEKCIVKFLILVHLIDFLPTRLYVDATHATNAPSAVSATTTLSGKFNRTKTPTTIKMTTTTDEITTSETTTKAPTEVDSKTTLLNTTDHEPSKNVTLMFYISLAMGSVFATLFFLLIIILVTRSMRQKKAKKKRADYLANINRACQRQYLANEGVSSNNPMYEGHSRATSNVLYGVLDKEDARPESCRTNENVVTVLSQKSTEVVIGNASCEVYQNVDDLYTEPGKFPETGNYERIGSFILYENSDVKTSTEGSYAEPSVLFEIALIAGNSGYVSAEPRTS